MTKDQILDEYGLFTAKVPRYTSYPPANRFVADAGRSNQPDWLSSVDPDKPVSVYIHIPFCRRLCWFCACRTQGTMTLRPVEAYVSAVQRELLEVGARLPEGVRMARLHLGGGTPTILNAVLMDRLLSSVHRVFDKAEGFEFSVEIDPTEAQNDVIDMLAAWGMDRASIGVQDFEPAVQKAIGRRQSIAETRYVLDRLRGHGVNSLNLDLLYGLPHQTEATLAATLDVVADLAADRLALYGYAHVPWMSKRQTMIPSDALPDARSRYAMSQLAARTLEAYGFETIGIDHFARPSDGLATAYRQNRLRRNFQGYTDDTCETLIGFGASAISKFREGYVQNAPATAAYTQRVSHGGLAGFKGIAMDCESELMAAMIEDLMCYGRIDGTEIARRFPDHRSTIAGRLCRLHLAFPLATRMVGDCFVLDPAYAALTRIVAARLDNLVSDQNAHSIAI